MSAVAVTFTGVAFILFLCMAVWMDTRKKMQERQLMHEERVKSLELGHPLPDLEISRIQAESGRTTAAGLIGIFVPAIATGAGLGATELLNHRYEELLAGIWIGCGVVAVTAVHGSLKSLRRRGKADSDKETPPAAKRGYSDSRSAVTAERPSTI